MNQLAHLHQQVELGLQELQLPNKPDNLYESIKYIIDLGGKRLRPVMVLLGNDVFGGQLNKALPAALSIELFHNFSLMHDDIMDNADLRRGKPSVHVQWNLPTAILGGDALLVVAYQQLMKSSQEHVVELLNLFNVTALEVCEGQQMDMNFEVQNDVSVADYLEMIRLKTAVLMGASFKMGAIIANASNFDADLMYQFGQDLGVAFQLKDDFLDCFGNPSFGKVIGGDILENKKTLMYLHAQHKGSQNQQEELAELANVSDAKTKIHSTLKLFEATGAKAAAENKMNEYYKKALANLNNLHLSDVHKETLGKFAESIWQRQK
ncbi:MAG: polyprenyl synthetase family protein [Bacteroidetes bacterium]|nr:polyprenyl synthetase family protein [Bacteroidota bacterium]